LGAVSVELTVDDSGGGTAHLPAQVRLAGDVDVGDASARLDGALGDLPLALTAAWDGPLTATAEIGPPDQDRVVATFDAATGVVTAAGGADVAAFWRLATGQEAPLAGTLSIDASGRLRGGAVDGLSGTATVAVTSPVAATAELTGRDDAVAATLRAELGDLPVRGAGQVRLADLSPTTTLLTLDVGPLEGLALTGSGLEGSGTFPGVTAGPAQVPDVP